MSGFNNISSNPASRTSTKLTITHSYLVDGRDAMARAVLDVDAAVPRSGGQEENGVLPPDLVVGGRSHVDGQPVTISDGHQSHASVLALPVHVPPVMALVCA